MGVGVVQRMFTPWQSKVRHSNSGHNTKHYCVRENQETRMAETISLWKFLLTICKAEPMKLHTFAYPLGRMQSGEANRP